jgi:hypothetical protein
MGMTSTGRGKSPEHVHDLRVVHDTDEATAGCRDDLFPR